MSKEFNRAGLLKTLALVRPALASGDYLPALQHIRFDGDYATAFNDISAISVRCDLNVERCVPGELLIKTLQSFNKESVLAQQNGAELKLSSGRSNMKLPTLETGAFPLKWPQDDAVEIELTPMMARGIERCLLNVGNDPTHPESMGVTLDSADGDAHLYSTDDFTMSRFETGDRLKLPGGSPVIMPTFFCEQLVSLAKSFPKEAMVLRVHSGALTIDFGDQARLFTRVVFDKEPLDFQGMFAKQLKGVKKLDKELIPIPDAFDAALSRALLVAAGETDKVTTFEMGKEGFSMHSSSAMGEADDDLKTEDDVSFDSPEEVHLDPQFVARGAKVGALMGFLKGALVLADKEARFVHLVAYCAK